LKDKGITTLKEMKELTDEEVVAKELNLICSPAILKKWREEAATCLQVEAPIDIDHRKSDNPYKSRYGEDWETVINANSHMSPYVCVTSMIEHICVETEKVMKGTKHEEDWYFYHDALALMTAKDTTDWMKEKGYYRRWLLPVNGLSKDNQDLKKFWDRPIGNSPEMMPWDCSLNRDVNIGADRHIVATVDLDETDPKKFSLSTPVRGTHAYLRVLHPETGGIPTSGRIVQDIEKVLPSMKTIHEHEGEVVEGLGDRQGKRRREVAGTGTLFKAKEQRGGKRTRTVTQFKDVWMHPDASAALVVKIETAEKRHKRE
jgi:hypothetical protein